MAAQPQTHYTTVSFAPNITASPTPITPWGLWLIVCLLAMVRVYLFGQATSRQYHLTSSRAELRVLRAEINRIQADVAERTAALDSAECIANGQMHALRPQDIDQVPAGAGRLAVTPPPDGSGVSPSPLQSANTSRIGGISNGRLLLSAASPSARGDQWSSR